MRPCFNCHAIDLRRAPNPEGAEQPAFGTWAATPQGGKIGVELSTHGTKPLAQFDFGFTEVPHALPTWLQSKVMEPRSWDKGKYKGNHQFMKGIFLFFKITCYP